MFVVSVIRAETSAHGASLREAFGHPTKATRVSTAVKSALVAEPGCRINRRWPSVRSAVANLEVKMGGKIRVGDADATDHLALRDGLQLPHVGAVQRSVDRVVAAAVIDDDGQTVGSELPHADDFSVGHRTHAGAHTRLDADAVPANRRVARRLRLTKRVDERAIHRPIELAVVAGL